MQQSLQQEEQVQNFIQELEIDSQSEEEEAEIMHEIYRKLGIQNKKASFQNWEEKAEALFIIQNLFGQQSDKEKNKIEKTLADQFQHSWRKKEQVCERGSYLFINEYNMQEIIQVMQERTMMQGCAKGLSRARCLISSVAQVIMKSQLFQYITLSVIIMNSIKMAFDDNKITQFDQNFDIFFNTFYSIEMAIKIIALGFVLNNGAYLRDAWNILDFIIVITSLLPYILTVNVSLKALRVFRVLRPLRTITKIKQLKDIVGTLFAASRLILDCIILLFFFNSLFAIVGLQLFKGNFKNVCINLSDGKYISSLCSSNSDCGNAQVCGRGIANYDNEISFDTYPWGLLMVYQGVTVQAWSEIMSFMMLTVSYLTIFFYIPIVLVGNNMLQNLLIAIINFKFAEFKGKRGVEVTTNQEFRWEISKMKNLVHKNQNLFYDRISAFKSGVMISEKTVSTGRGLFRVGVSWESKKLIRKISQRVISKNLISEHKIQVDKQQQVKEDQNSELLLPQIKRQTRLKQLSGIKFNFFNQESEDLLKRLHFEPIILKPFYKQIQIQPQIVQQEDDLNDSINTQQLIQSKKKENPEARQIRYRKRKMQEMNRFLMELKGKAPEPSPPQLIEQIEKFDFSKVNPEVLHKNYEELFDDLLIDNYLRDIRCHRQEVVQNVLQPEQENCSQKQQEQKSVKQQNRIQKQVDELKQANRVADLLLKIRVKEDQELQEIIKFNYRDIILDKERKQQAERKRKLMEKNQQTNAYSLLYQYQSPNDQEIKYQHVLKLPSMNKVETPPEQIAEASRDILESEKTIVKNQPKGIAIRKLKIQDPFLRKSSLRKNKLLKDNQITNNFFDMTIKDKQEIQTESVAKDYILRRSDEFIDGNSAEESISFQTLAEVPEHFPVSINIEEGRYYVYLTGILGLLQVFRNRLKTIAFSSFLDNFMMLCVIANTVVLSLNGIIDSNNPVLAYLNTAFTFIFTFDCTIKIIALGVNYFREPMNNFDLVVVILSIYDLASNGFAAKSSKYTAFRSIRIFRAFRVLRVAKFIRSLKYMQVIIAVINATLSEFIYILLLLLLFLYIYTLLGMQIFSQMINSTTYPRQNFNSFLQAFVTAFDLMTTSNWNDVFANIEKTDMVGSGFIGAFYCISWIFIGNYCLLNLFLAILLDGFGGDSEQLKEDIKELQQELQIIQSSQDVIDLSTTNDQTTDRLSQQARGQRSTKLVRLSTVVHRTAVGVKIKSKCEMSLFMFSRSNLFRRYCYEISTWRYFELLTQFMIAISSAKLIFDTYITQDSSQFIITLSFNINVAITIFFAAEMTVKMIAQGFVLDDHSYLRDNWSKLDFIIVVFSFLDIILYNVNLSFIKIMRSLRPLRFISSSVSFKIIVSALFESVSGLLNIGFVVFLVWLMFGILLINLLSGSLFYCQADSYFDYTVYDFNQQQCSANFLPNAYWRIYDLNFQNIGNGMLSLFVLGSKQDWPTYFYSWVDSNSIKPIYSNSFITYTILIIAFIMVGSYFLINLITGVIFFNYHIAEKKLKTHEASPSQENWVIIQRLILQSKPNFLLLIIPANPFRNQVYRLISSIYFELFISLCIMLNVVSLAAPYDDNTPQYELVISYCNYFFSGIFFLELVLKLIAYGFEGYFSKGWFIFDFIVVSFFFADLAITFSPLTFDSTFIRILPQIGRIFRVFRLIRLLRVSDSFKGIQKLLQTLYYSIPSLLNALALLLLTQFFFAVLGANLFKTTPPRNNQFAGLTQFFNFNNFHSSMLSMFIWTTGQNWYRAMFDTIADQGYIVCIFWVVFQILVPNILVQLFVLVMLDEFDQNYNQESNPFTLYNQLEEDFIQQWVKLSDKGQGLRIQERKVIDIYLNLRKPLGLNMQERFDQIQRQLLRSGSQARVIKQQLYDSKLKMKKEASRDILSMRLSAQESYINYHDLFYHIAKKAFFQLDGSGQENDFTLKKNEWTEKQLQNRKISSENQKKKKEVNPLVRMLYSQMVINAWARYANLKQNLKDDQSITQGVQVLVLKTNHRRDQRSRTKVLGMPGLSQTRSDVPETGVYNEDESRMGFQSKPRGSFRNI